MEQRSRFQATLAKYSAAFLNLMTKKTLTAVINYNACGNL
jgi:hypothetical protein